MSHRRPWREDPDVYASDDNLAGWVAFGVLVVALAAILCGLSGCSSPRGQAKTYHGAIKADAQSIQDDTVGLDPHVAPAGKPLVKDIQVKAQRIAANADAASRATDADAKAAAATEAKLHKLEGSVGVKLERAFWRFFYLIVIGVPVGAIVVGFLTQMPGLWGLLGNAVLTAVKWLNPGKWFAHGGSALARFFSQPGPAAAGAPSA